MRWVSMMVKTWILIFQLDVRNYLVCWRRGYFHGYICMVMVGHVGFESALQILGLLACQYDT